MYTSMMRKAMLGDTATLNLDFSTGTLDSRLTFTRSGTGTYINSSGYVTTASTNDARFEYDPVTLAASGLLIEGSATNLLNWSETFATTGGTNNNWADTNLTRTSTNNTSPRNDATALRITASAGNGTIISSAAIGTSASRTLSVWLRRVTGTGNIQYTLDNGTNWTTQVITSSWVRYSFAATTAAQRVGFRIVTSGDAIEVWGAQLEAGSGASSYIVTVASQVTRNGDQCELTSGVPALYDSATGTGTILIDVSYSSLVNANGGIELGAGTGNQGSTNRVSDRVGAIYVGGTGLFVSPTVGGQRLKTITAFAPSDLAASRNGNSAVTSSTNVTLTGMTALKFYIDAWAGGSLPVYGAVRQVKIWPTRLPNATIQTLSAL